MHDQFSHQEKKKKISYISIPKVIIYLFKHFYFSLFNSTQFLDFASLKIKMWITFAKPFNVLNNFSFAESIFSKNEEIDNCERDIPELFLSNEQIIWYDSSHNICLSTLLQ